ncbi:hypothetical protein EIP91_003382 [Steccherinum ochraceum]|uniref:ABM domain-containing protein n=1 Tax=Steccherinum ochraceum TaxID=92696 RepID=A0A4R0RJ29_9APHY|nr:hypothetical protein EIP91_003382 [Steccherinum ochraceum]
MSETVVEIVNWLASEAFKSDPSILHPALKQVAAAKGASKIWYGLQHEDQSTVFVVIVWASLADHKLFIDDKAPYAELLAKLTPTLDASAGAIEFYHVAFKPNPIPEAHFNCPINEFGILTLKEGKTNAEIEELVWNPEFNDGGKVFDIGKIIERDNQYVLTKGWESVEAHHAARAYRSEQLSQFVTAAREIITPAVCHVKLTMFKS